MSNYPDFSALSNPVVITVPPDDLAERPLRYGHGLPFQLAPGKAGLVLGVRYLHAPIVDFESGADVVLFESWDELDTDRAITIARGDRQLHPKTGDPLIMSPLHANVHFVPLGAKTLDGKPHPHEGTGFSLLKFRGVPTDMSDSHPCMKKDLFFVWRLFQFSYDGTSFRVDKVESFNAEELFPGYDVRGYGLGSAIRDGEDLLWGMTIKPTPDSFAQSGVGRWRKSKEGWYPVEFTSVTPCDTSIEGNVIRDVDGSLLFAARCIAHDKGDAVSHGIRVWRSTDAGKAWEQVVSAPRTRASTPVVLNQWGDGTPVVGANPFETGKLEPDGKPLNVWNYRQQMCLWPLAEDRRSLLEPFTLRDTDMFFAAPAQRIWYADHLFMHTIHLRDGGWQTVVNYRVRVHQPTGKEGEPATSITGCHLQTKPWKDEEVFSGLKWF